MSSTPNSPRIQALETPTYVNGVITTTATSVADTWTDVTSSSLVLPVGYFYELILEAALTLVNNTGAIRNIYGNVAITDNSNVLQDNAMAVILRGLNPSNTQIDWIRLSARVSAGTYKLRVRCTDSVANGYAALQTTVNQTGGLTDPDLGYRWYAKRIGVV